MRISDFAQPTWRRAPVLDAIVADRKFEVRGMDQLSHVNIRCVLLHIVAPYGVREGAKKIGPKDPANVKPVKPGL